MQQERVRWRLDVIGELHAFTRADVRGYDGELYPWRSACQRRGLKRIGISESSGPRCAECEQVTGISEQAERDEWLGWYGGSDGR